MNILGVETSCDETAAAIVEDGIKLRSNVVASQIELHAQYGGVIPELAARSHIAEILPVIQLAIKQAEIDWSQIDAIAVANGPGLLGSLLIGTLTAATLAELKAKPLIPVDHVEAHLYANFLNIDKPLKFPILALIVSGGHTQLVLFKNHHNHRILGQTRDDAAGEAFDKIAKILNLGYPGGPAIATAAQSGNALAYTFPKAKLSNRFDFSFSGLKTAVLRQAQLLAGKDFRALSTTLYKNLNKTQVQDLAASFQKTVIDTLVKSTKQAFELYRPQTVVIAGGVAANQLLRETLRHELSIQIQYAPIEFCTDNAAMIAAMGYYQRNKTIDPKKLQANPVLSM